MTTRPTPEEMAEIRARAAQTIGMRVSQIDRLAADADRDALLAEVDALTSERDAALASTWKAVLGIENVKAELAKLRAEREPKEMP